MRYFTYMEPRNPPEDNGRGGMMSGDHNMYCSGNQPDLIEKLRETYTEIVKDTLPRWKNVDEYLNDAADEIERLRKELKNVRNHAWGAAHWTEYEYNIARTEREACIDCIKAFSTVGDRSEEMIIAILRREARGEK